MRYHSLVEHRPSANPVVLVTGGTGALGAALVSRLLADQARVAFTYRSNADLAARLEAAGALPVACDLAKSGQAARAVATVRQSLGEVDALVHAAMSAIRPTRFDAAGAKALADMHKVQAEGLLALLDAVLPAMRHRQDGTILGVLSEALVKPHVPGWAAYTAAKAALAAVLHGLAEETAPCGVRVLAALPGALAVRPAQGRGEPDASVARRFSPFEEANARGLRANWPLGLDPDRAASVMAEALRDQAGYPSGSWITISALGKPTVRPGAWFFGPGEPAPNRQAVAQSAGEASVSSDVGPAPQGVSSQSPGGGDPLAARLAEVFRKALKLGPDDAVDQAALGLWKGWDSLNHLRLLMDVEAAFGVDFSGTEAGELITFASLLAAVRRLTGHA